MNYLVTGGSRGIGFAVAQKIASMGYNVTLSARNADLLNHKKNELLVVRESQNHDVWPIDLSNLNEVNGLKGLPKPLNQYAGLINCAGVASSALTVMQSFDSIDKILKVNFHAPILLAKALGKAMLRNKDIERKHIIFISSILARKGMAGSAVYGATKAGIEAFSRSFARECGSKGIIVNSIAPGLVDTDMGRAAHPSVMDGNILPGMIPSSEIANAVEFLLNSKSITGQVITIDNGCSS